MRKSLHVQADRLLIPTRRAARRWLRVDVVAPPAPPEARSVRLLVEVPRGASVVSPNPYRKRSEGPRTVFELGSLVVDQLLSLVLCVELPPAAGGDAAVEVRLKDEGGTLDPGPVRVRFTCASAAASAAQPRDNSVASDAARAYAARARQRAAALGRAGRHEEARAVLARMAGRLREYAGRDRTILQIVDGLADASSRLEMLGHPDLELLEKTAAQTLASLFEDGAPFRAVEAVGLRMHQGAPPRGDDPFSVVVVTPDGAATRLADAAGRALAGGSPSGFGFEVVDGLARVLDPGSGALVPRMDEKGLAVALGARPDRVKVALLRGRLEGDVPSRWYPAHEAAVVSLHGWDEADPLTRPYVAHQLAAHSCRRGRPAFDPGGAPHPDSVGCWGDPDSSRADVEARLRAGFLCDACRRRYGEAGIDVEAFLCYVAIVRRLANGPAPRRA